MFFKAKIVFYWIKFRIRTKFQDKDQLRKHQEIKLKKFSKNILAKSPFYKKYKIETLSDLVRIPIVEKEQFMNHFDEINTVGITKELALQTALEAERSRDFSPELNGITVGLSTGTSGKRGLFLVSENERAQWVAMVMTRVIRPSLFKKQKIAFFLRASSNLYSSVNSSLFTFRYYDLFQPIQELADQLNLYKPDILAAPPSVLADLATYQTQNKISLFPIQIISFAEVMYDADRIFIEQVFNLKIKEIYQCTEGFLAVSCKYGNIHLNEDVVHVEKEYLTPTRFHPIITDFTRTTQPVVRYRLNDVLIEKEEACPCGSVFTALEKIEGRSDDVLLFDVKGKKVKIYPDLICRKIAQYTDNFRTYAIIQSGWNVLQVNIQSSDYENTKNAFNRAIEDVLSSVGVEQVKIIFSSQIHYERGVKVRKIERRFHED